MNHLKTILAALLILASPMAHATTLSATSTEINLYNGRSYYLSVTGFSGHLLEVQYESGGTWHTYEHLRLLKDCLNEFTVIGSSVRFKITGGTGNLEYLMGETKDRGTIGKQAVNIRAKTTRPLDLFFGQLGNLTTTSVQAEIDDTTLTLTSTTGFVAGTRVGVFSATDADAFYLGTQIGAPSGNIITLDTPIDQVLAAGSAVAASSIDLAVDGSVTTQHFQIGPVGGESTQTVNITRILGHLLDSTAMDDSLFGGLPALTNGVVLRHNNHKIENIWNVKTNADLALICFDFRYSTRAPGGQFGCNFRNTYGGTSRHGVVIDLQPGDFLEILIQDDLTGLDEFQMMAQGYFKD
jgi:hypothetical protein